MATLAIVDSRNVHGQTQDVLGVAATPTVAGVVDGLSLYGFDVTEVQVGLALARRADQAALAIEHSTNVAYQNEILADPRGRVLLGELHLKAAGPPRIVDEKIVDVQCALAVALSARDIADGKSSFDSIVVCSQDIDIRPALEYAVGLGVPVWVAAHEVVDRRPQPHLLLTCEPLSRFRPPTGVCGHERRSLVAAAALAPDVRTWTAVGRLGASRMWSVVDADGTPGMCDEAMFGSPPTPGVQVSLGVHSINFGSQGRAVPVVYCNRTPAPAPLAVEGIVRRRLRLNRLEVTIAGTRHEVTYPPGGVLANWRVAIKVTPATATQPERLAVIGPHGPPTVSNQLKQLACSATPMVVEATTNSISSSRTEVRGAMGRLLLSHPPAKPPAPGEKLAVALADAGGHKFLPVVHRLSSAL